MRDPNITLHYISRGNRIDSRVWRFPEDDVSVEYVRLTLIRHLQNGTLPYRPDDDRCDVFYVYDGVPVFLRYWPTVHPNLHEHLARIAEFI
jgi:hypothetical protein